MYWPIHSFSNAELWATRAKGSGTPLATSWTSLDRHAGISLTILGLMWWIAVETGGMPPGGLNSREPGMSIFEAANRPSSAKSSVTSV